MNQDSAAFLRAIRGPVMMITVGALFALDSFTSLSFGRTWPILLVIAGLLSLGKSAYGKSPSSQGRVRYQAKWGPPQPPATPPPPPPSASPVNPTAGPGTYRGSAYEATPGSPSRGSESKEPRSNPNPASDPGVTP
jgi:hypothetical protein